MPPTAPPQSPLPATFPTEGFIGFIRLRQNKDEARPWIDYDVPFATEGSPTMVIPDDAPLPVGLLYWNPTKQCFIVRTARGGELVS